MDVGIRSEAPCAGEAGSQGGAEVRLFADPQVRDWMCSHTMKEASIAEPIQRLSSILWTM